MEKKDNKYKKLIEMLRRNEPALSNVENIADYVMLEISREKEHRNIYLDALEWIFRWTYIPWMRNALTTAMIVIIAFFVFQYTGLSMKVTRLESQLIQSDYNFYKSPYHSGQSLMKYTLPGSFLKSDSVSVSRDDLLKLLEEYRELERKSHEIKPAKKSGILRHFFRSDTNKLKSGTKYPSI
jgi:hypothetical protein